MSNETKAWDLSPPKPEQAAEPARDASAIPRRMVGYLISVSADIEGRTSRPDAVFLSPDAIPVCYPGTGPWSPRQTAEHAQRITVYLGNPKAEDFARWNAEDEARDTEIKRLQAEIERLKRAGR